MSEKKQYTVSVLNEKTGLNEVEYPSSIKEAKSLRAYYLSKGKKVTTNF